VKTRGDTHGRFAALPPEKKTSRTCVHSSAKWIDASSRPIAPNTAQLERPLGCEKSTKTTEAIAIRAHSKLPPCQNHRRLPPIRRAAPR
jgi:hypothetical protein